MDFQLAWGIGVDFPGFGEYVWIETVRNRKADAWDRALEVQASLGMPDSGSRAARIARMRKHGYSLRRVEIRIQPPPSKASNP